MKRDPYVVIAILGLMQGRLDVVDRNCTRTGLQGALQSEADTAFASDVCPTQVPTCRGCRGQQGCKDHVVARGDHRDIIQSRVNVSQDPRCRPAAAENHKPEDEDTRLDRVSYGSAASTVHYLGRPVHSGISARTGLFKNAGGAKVAAPREPPLKCSNRRETTFLLDIFSNFFVRAPLLPSK